MSKHEVILGTATSTLESWTAADFLNRDLPAKEAVVETLLYLRDIVTFAGRRRHGKTTFLCNLAIAVALGLKDFLGYNIPKPRRVAIYFLEDDPREIQDKLSRMMAGRPDEGRLFLQTRDDFYQAAIPIGVVGTDRKDTRFLQAVWAFLEEAKPEVVIFDNLAHLIGADYNDSKKVHLVMQLAWQITHELGAAVIFAAHPRKLGGDNKAGRANLRKEPESFFEEVMGSSHTINSTGGLWAIERNQQTGRTYFLGGSQRLTGEQGLASLAKNDCDWFELVPDISENLAFALNTEKRKKAWALIPERFSYLEAEKAVSSEMAAGTFSYWWRELTRLGLVVSCGEGWRKVDGLGIGRNPSR